MPTFKKRVFGSEVPQDIILEFERLGTGGRIEEAKDAAGMPVIVKGEGRVLEQVNPTYQNYDLGDKTPISRMWTAVAVTEFYKESYDAHKGEKVDVNSKRRTFYKPTEDKSVILGSEEKTTKKLIFTVGENHEESYGVLEPKDPIDGTGNVQVKRQLTQNPLMKPEAGITSISAKTQGALGAIQSTTVNFVVHNKFDFENIFLPYFLRPGSIVCVDYGWSNTPLYNIEEQIKNSDIHLSEFHNFLYNTHLKANFGHTNSVMGNVVSYDSSVNQDGSFECSIEIVSQNASLLDQGIGGEDNVKFLFTNTINDVIAAVYARNRGINFSLEHIKKNLSSASPVNTSEISKRFISEISDVKKSDNGDVLKGQLNKIAIKEGIFHQDMQPNKTPDTNSLRFVVSKLLNENKARREAFVTDETLKSEVTYISFGFFEDLFLNNFVTGVIKPGKGGERRAEGDTTEQQFEKKPDSDFSIKFDTRGVFVRYDDLFIKIQTAPTIEGESLSKFLLPTNWDESYNTRKLKSLEKNNNDLDFFIEDENNTFTQYCLGTNKKYHPDYPNQKVIPLRDVFISVPLITNAFETAKSVNDALVNLFDDLNTASNNVWNLKLTFSNEGRTGIRVIDANMLPESGESRLVFDVTGQKSLVSACDLKYKTPSDGLSSILAIGNMSGPNTFHDLDLASFAYLNLLNKPIGKESQPVKTVSLPYQGDMNEFNKEQEAKTIDYFSIYSTVNTLSDEEGDAGKNAKNKYEYYLESVKTQLAEELEFEEEENKEFNIPVDAEYEKESREVEYVDSYRDYYKKLLKDKYFDREGDGSLSPILPIELSLSIYGNTYLQYGDYFTINYLPQYYKNRVFFQIVGISDAIDPNGWTTTYETVMRVDPKFKSLISGEKKGGRLKKLSINSKLDPVSGLTSVGRGAKGSVKDNIQTVLEQITKNREDLSLIDDTVLQDSFDKSGLQFRAVKYNVLKYEKWKSSIQKNNLKGTKDNFQHYIRFQNTKASLSNLTSFGNLCYAFAIREAFIGKDTIIDYERLLEKELVIMGTDRRLYGPRQTSTVAVNNQHNTKDLILIMDKVDEGKAEDPFSGDDFFDIWSNSHLNYKPGKSGSVIRSEFEKLFFPKLKELTNYEFDNGFKKVMENTKFQSNEIEKDLTTTVFAGNFGSRKEIKGVPVPIMSIYTGIPTEKGLTETENSTMFMTRILSGQTVFENIAIPKHLMKAEKTINNFLKTISESYIRYKNGLDFS